MRLCYLIPLFAITVTVSWAAAAATPNRAAALAKVVKYESIWTTSQMGTFLDPVMADIIALKTMAQIGDNVMSYAIGVYSSNMLAAMPLLTLKSNMDTCLKPYNSTAMDTLSTVLTGVGLGMTKSYKLLKAKVKAMQANGKTNAQIQEQLYYLTSAVCTPNLVQHLLWFSMKNTSSGQWSCCVQYMPSLLIVPSPQFDLTYRPDKWMYAYKK